MYILSIDYYRYNPNSGDKLVEGRGLGVGLWHGAWYWTSIWVVDIHINISIERQL